MPFPLLAVVGIAAGLYFLTKDDESKQPQPSGSAGSDGESSAGESSDPAGTDSGTDGNASGGENEGENKTRTKDYDRFTSDYARTPYHDAIAQTEIDNDLPENLLARLIWAESKFSPTVSHANKNGTTDIGIAQINSAYVPENVDPMNPEQSIAYAGSYLAQLGQQFGNWRAAAVAYNWGPGNVKNSGLDAAPAESLAYADGIIADSEA